MVGIIVVYGILKQVGSVQRAQEESITITSLCGHLEHTDSGIWASGGLSRLEANPHRKWRQTPQSPGAAGTKRLRRQGPYALLANKRCRC